jgi:hypothetical protein
VREGYHVALIGNFLVIKNVPYVTSDKSVEHDGWLVDKLMLAGDATSTPEDHTMKFTGPNPCDTEGQVLRGLESGTGSDAIAEGLVVQRTFSQKPVNATGKYTDYYEKVTHYIALISPHASVLDPTATAKTFPVIKDDTEESVFNYIDNASSNAGITRASERLELSRIAIIGLGGTGAYILDLLAKTPIGEIHLFDGDVFLQHNAFRAPGAATLEQLEAKPKKVDYYTMMYSGMRRSGIVPHPYHMTEEHLPELAEMQFIFMAFDGGPDKRAVMDFLVANNISFIDVGLGLTEHDGTIGGTVRTSIVTPDNAADASDNNHIPNTAAVLPNDYDRNIQVADINALNATLAVIRFKKTLGFYQDQEHERRSFYMIGGNYILNGEPL